MRYTHVRLPAFLLEAVSFVAGLKRSQRRPPESAS